MNVPVAEAMTNFASEPESLMHDIILQNEGALEGLLHSLSSHDNPDLQEKASTALKNPGVGGEFAKLKILNHGGVLTGLVTSLAKDENRGLQKQAAWTLQNLAVGPESAEDRISEAKGGALEGLVHSLCSQENPSLHEKGVGVLANLASNGGESTKLQVLESGRGSCGDGGVSILG